MMGFVYSRAENIVGEKVASCSRPTWFEKIAYDDNKYMFVKDSCSFSQTAIERRKPASFHKKVVILTLFFIDIHFDPSTTDRFLIKLWEKEKLLITSNSPFPTMFSTQSDNCVSICSFFFTSSFFAAELEELKIGISGKRLTLY